MRYDYTKQQQRAMMNSPTRLVSVPATVLPLVHAVITMTRHEVPSVFVTVERSVRGTLNARQPQQSA